MSDEQEYAGQVRFNTMAFIAFLIAAVAASPMLDHSVGMMVILAFMYMPIFAVVYIGLTSPAWQNYFKKHVVYAMSAAMGALTLVALLITRMIAAVFHASNGMYG